MFNNELWQKPTAAGATGFYSHQIAKSIRADTNNGYLHRTPSSAGNRATWTFSTWIKLSQMGTGTRRIYSAGSSGDQDGFYTLFYNANKLVVSSANANFVTPSDTFRDPSAWYHIVWRQGSNATTLYVNGSQIATASVSGNTAVNNNTLQCIGTSSFGGSPTNGEHLDGYFAETIMIDGTALDPDSFGETKNGVWIPKDASGLTYGTNGFRLSYGNASDLGEDSAGSNDWTAVNLATHDQMLDTPTFGSEGSANFPLWSPLFKGAQNLSEGNTRFDCSTGGKGSMTSWAIATGTKFYIECLVEHVTGFNIVFGIANPQFDVSSYDESDATMNGILFRANSGSSWDTCSLTNGSRGSFGSNVGTTAGRVLAMTVNRVDNEIKMYLDNSLKHTISISATEEYHIVCTTDGGNNAAVHMNINAGHDSTGAGDFSAGSATDENGYGSFQNAPPSGFLALCSGNLPVADAVDPAQTDDNYPQKLFGVPIWTGDASTGRAITGLGFQPDVVWFKSRSSAFSNRLYDTTRGISSTGGKRLFPNTNGAETNQTSGQDISAVGTDGFTLGASSNLYTNDTNSGGLQVAWTWRANGGTTSSNGNGSITSTVQVDPSGCFSIVKYTGEAATRTIGHGLSAIPNLIIVKSLDNTRNWGVYYGDNTDALQLNNDNATDDGVYWADTSPTSTVFTVGDSSETGKSEDYIAYCFANCEGYMKFGSYVGNADDDGTFTYTGFQPAMVVVKLRDSSGDWWVQDDGRSPYNPANKYIAWNRSDAEATGIDIDLLSNGFKIRTTSGDANSSGATIQYIAIAKNPFKYATAR